MAFIVQEQTSETLGELLREDDSIAVWWGSWVECAVAISRLLREGWLDEQGEGEARASLDLLAEDWYEVQATDEVRTLAAILSRRQPLRAADALQLAAAFVWRESTDENPDFVCLDDRLRRAAREEGFDVLPEALEPA
jgi:predicted nucleic acid-binding protein